MSIYTPDWDKIIGALSSTTTEFGGEWANLISDYFNGVNIGLTNPTKKPKIGTETFYKYEKLSLLDNDESHTITLSADDIDTGPNRKIIIRRMNNPNETDWLVLENLPQALKGKTIDLNFNTLQNISNSHIAVNAAIAYSKLNLAGSIVNLDVAVGAGITYNKLNLADSLVNADIATNAAIEYSKLNLTGGIVNTDIATNATIATSKLADSANFLLKTLDNDLGTHYIEMGQINVPATPPTGKARIFFANSTKMLSQVDDAGVVTPINSGSGGGGGGGGGSGNGLGGNGGTISFNGDVTTSKKVFNIPHELGVVPTTVSVEPVSIDSFGDYTVTKDATNIIITYQFPPPTGTNNITFEWLALTGAAENVHKGFIELSGNAVDTQFLIPHGLTSTPVSFWVDPASVDALGEFTRTIDATNIIINYQVPPASGTNNLEFYWGALTNDALGLGAGGGGGATTALADLTDDVDTVTTPPTNNQVLTWNAGSSLWIPLDAPGAAGGETNSGLNVGSTGEGLYKQKVGAVLEFYKIASENNLLTVALQGTDYLALTVNQSNMNIANMTGSIGNARITDLNWAKLSGVPLSFTPTEHATTHYSGGSDPLNITSLGGFTGNLDAYLRADGTFAIPPGTGEGGGGGSGGGPANVTGGGTIGNIETRNGDASNPIFIIPHNLGIIPNSVSVEAASIDAIGDYRIDVDATNITLTYQSPPPLGTGNLSWYWMVSFDNQPVSMTKGDITFDGDVSTDKKVFEIPHGLSETPDSVWVKEASVDALGFYRVDVDDTNITITYQVAPPSGTDNIRFLWGAVIPATVLAGPIGSFGIEDLGNVNIPTTPTDGYVLTWDSTPGEWVAAAAAGGGGSGDVTGGSNLGAGIGVFKTENATTHVLEFKTLNNGSVVTVAANGDGNTIDLGIANTSITNAMLAGSIAKSKLGALNIVDADIDAAAAIVTSKLADSANFAMKNTTNTFTALQTINTGSGYPISLQRDVKNANSDVGFQFIELNSSDSPTSYAAIVGGIMTNTAGLEDGILKVQVRKAGTLTNVMQMDADGIMRIGNNGQRLRLSDSGLTTARTFTYPDRSGQVGLTTDPLERRTGSYQPVTPTTPSATNIGDLVGMLSNHVPTGAGTNSVAYDTIGLVIIHSTSSTANQNAGLVSPTGAAGIVRRLYAAKMTIKSKVDTVAGGVSRFYFGVSSSSTIPIGDTVLGASDSGIIVGFNAADTNYTIRNNDGTATAVSTAVTGPIAKNTSYHTITIEWPASGNVTVTFDGTSQTLSTRLPAVATPLFFHCSVQNATAAVRTHSIKGVWIESEA